MGVFSWAIHCDGRTGGALKSREPLSIKSSPSTTASWRHSRVEGETMVELVPSAALLQPGTRRHPVGSASSISPDQAIFGLLSGIIRLTAALRAVRDVVGNVKLVVPGEPIVAIRGCPHLACASRIRSLHVHPNSVPTAPFCNAFATMPPVLEPIRRAGRWPCAGPILPQCGVAKLVLGHSGVRPTFVR